MSGFDGYDQWKTASPYDDEPDMVQECERVAMWCDKHIKAHAEMSDLTHAELMLLESCRDTLNAAAEYVEVLESLLKKGTK